MMQRDYTIELIIGFVAFLVFIISVYISKKTNKKPYKILIVILGIFVSLVTAAGIAYLVDSQSVDLNYNSGQFFGGFLFIYLIFISKKKPKN